MHAVLYIAPAIAVLGAVFLFPLAYGVGLSLFELVRGQWHWVGVANYVRLFQDGDFWNGAKVSLIYTVVSVAAKLTLGLAVALLLNQQFRGRALARVLILVPWMVAPAIVGVIWRWIWDSQFGVANGLLAQFGLIDRYLPWLGDSTLALVAVIVSSVWRGFPFIGLLLLAGLQTVPKEQYEAATVDGATTLQQFRHITMPNLRYVAMVATTLDFTWTFRGFDLVFTLTHGGPAKATEILPISIYLESFSYMRFGYASAMGVVLFLFLLAFTVAYIRLVRPVETT